MEVTRKMVLDALDTAKKESFSSPDELIDEVIRIIEMLIEDEVTAEEENRIEEIVAEGF